jgi:hypothetical protein
MGVVVIEVFVGAVVPLSIVPIGPEQLVVAEQVGLGLVVGALAMLVFGCARVDMTLRRRAVLAAVLVGIAAALGIAAIALQHHPPMQDVAPELVVGTLLMVSVSANLMVLRLLGKGVNVAEARAYGELVRAAEYKAEQARLVHERWRAARMR